MSSGDDTQFIVPPPGIEPTRQSQNSAQDEISASIDLIDLPPGIIDSKTYRTSTQLAPKPSTLNDAPPFFPIGASATLLDEATRISPRRHDTTSWRLALPDGHELFLARTALVGRDPARGSRWPDAVLVTLDDSARSISKTHAALEITASGQLHVHDLNSTNGVFLQYPGAEEIVVAPGTPELVEPGSVLGFGEFAVTVHRR